MLELEIRKSQSLSTKESLFLILPNSRKCVELVKALPKRRFNRHTSEWEMPINNFEAVLDVFADYDIEIKGKIPPRVQKKIQLQNAMLEQEDIELENYKFKTKPFDYQVESLKYSFSHDRFILADEQGLGKTKQAIDIAVSKKNKFSHCLVVCGVNGLKWNWRDEIKIHSNEGCHLLGHRITKNKTEVIEGTSNKLLDLKKHHDEFFIVVNIECFRDKKFCEAIKSKCMSGEIGMCIFDECHKAKSPTSEQGKGIHSIQSYYKIAMTGTPIMNSPLDLYNVMKWIGAEHHNFTDFKEHYCEFGGFGDNEIIAYKNLKELQLNLSKVMLRRTKSEVLNLPEKIRVKEIVEMSKDQTIIYKEVLTKIRENIDKVILKPNPLTELIRLRQCTSCPEILSSTLTNSAKFDRALELTQEALSNGNKVIIFSNWVKVIEPCLRLFKKAKISCAVITGETKDVDAELRKFKTDSNCKVIFGTISALGTGYTLTEANTVIFLDSPWTMADKNQAEDRAHRIGTVGSTLVYTLVCKDTIDEKIEQLIDMKGKLSDGIVDSKFEVTDTKQDIEFLLS